MLMVSNIPLHIRCPHTRNINIPSIRIMPFGQRLQNPVINGPRIYNLELGEPNPLFIPRRSRDPRYHHQLH